MDGLVSHVVRPLTRYNIKHEHLDIMRFHIKYTVLIVFRAYHNECLWFEILLFEMPFSPLAFPIEFGFPKCTLMY